MVRQLKLDVLLESSYSDLKPFLHRIEYELVIREKIVNLRDLLSRMLLKMDKD